MRTEILQNIKTFRFPLWTLGVGGTTAGWALGILPAMILITGAMSNGNMTDHATESSIVTNIFLGICVLAGFVLASGVAVAGSQWLVLRERLPTIADIWLSRGVISIGLGWFVGWIGSIQPFNTSHGDDKLGAFVISGIIIGATIGLIVGISQWRLLRQQLRHAEWWLAASLLGWISALVLYWLVYRAAGGPFETVVTSYYEGGFWPKTVDAPGAMPAMFAGWIVGGLVLGIITGGTMKLLMRHERQAVTEN
jgi:hypothetical protein